MDITGATKLRDLRLWETLTGRQPHELVKTNLLVETIEPIIDRYDSFDAAVLARNTEVDEWGEVVGHLVVYRPDSREFILVQMEFPPMEDGRPRRTNIWALRVRRTPD